MVRGKRDDDGTTKGSGEGTPWREVTPVKVDANMRAKGDVVLPSDDELAIQSFGEREAAGPKADAAYDDSPSTIKTLEAGPLRKIVGKDWKQG